MTTFRPLPLAVLLLLWYRPRGYAGQVAGSREALEHTPKRRLFRARAASVSSKVALDGLKMQSP
jgi:hypothetical protein